MPSSGHACRGAFVSGPTQPELEWHTVTWRMLMQEWHKPEVTEQEVGLEVTSYLPAELDHD